MPIAIALTTLSLQAKLFVLVSATMELTPEQVLKLLKQSGVITAEMIGGICDYSAEVQEWLTGAQVLRLLYDEAKPSLKFCKSYDEALEQDLINLQDKDMIRTLAEILQLPKFTSKNVCSVLKTTCMHANEWKIGGQFLFNFSSRWTNDIDDAAGLICDGMKIYL